MKQEPDSVVRLHEVTKRYPGAAQAALSPTSLSIARGEFFSLLGPSGSGKTTMLRLIAGFETPDTGQVELDGRDGTAEPPYRRPVSTVFQSYALFPHMTVDANVAFPLVMQKVPVADRPARVKRALELVEMGAFATRYPHQMSGGQRQRIALARAIVGQPSVLLLDEPLGALDLHLRQQMQHVLVELQRELGITFVYVTHDQGEALSMSNRVAVVEGGKIRQLGTPHELYFSPCDELVARFIGKSNLLDIQVSKDGSKSVGTLGDRKFGLKGNMAPGKCKLSLRFESVDVVPRKLKSAKPITLAGTIADVLFLGNVLEVKVDTPAGQILAYSPANRDTTLTPGMEVLVGIDPDDGCLFEVKS